MPAYSTGTRAYSTRGEGWRVPAAAVGEPGPGDLSAPVLVTAQERGGVRDRLVATLQEVAAEEREQGVDMRRRHGPGQGPLPQEGIGVEPVTERAHQQAHRVDPGGADDGEVPVAQERAAVRAEDEVVVTGVGVHQRVPPRRLHEPGGQVGGLLEVRPRRCGTTDVV